MNNYVSLLFSMLVCISTRELDSGFDIWAVKALTINSPSNSCQTPKPHLKVETCYKPNALLQKVRIVNSDSLLQSNEVATIWVLNFRKCVLSRIYDSRLEVLDKCCPNLQCPADALIGTDGICNPSTLWVDWQCVTSCKLYHSMDWGHFTLESSNKGFHLLTQAPSSVAS